MSLLKRRIVNQGIQYPDLHEVGQFNTPEVLPLSRVIINPGTIQYEDLTSIITPDGRPIAATGQGTWGQLYQAGMP
jgi:hypothetical protein